MHAGLKFSILGCEISGVVEQVGKNVSGDFKVGDEVVGTLIALLLKVIYKRYMSSR
jgi:NADPH:quinone reductase-like Zn-dependent oxidoreductase